MLKNKIIFGYVYVYVNNMCKYYVNGNIFYLCIGYWMFGCVV